MSNSYSDLEEKPVKRVLAIVAVLSMAIGATAVAQAQDKLRIGVVDMRKVVLESKPGQAHRVERDRLVKERRDKLAKEEQAVRALQEKMEKDKLVLTDKQKQEKSKEINDKATALQKAAQEAQQEVAKRDNEAMSKADAVLSPIVSDIAKQEKLSLVLDRNQAGGIVWVDDPIDITDKVLKAYEAKAAK